MFNFTPKLIIAIQTDAAAKVLCNPGFQKLVLNMGLLLTLELITAIQTDATAKVLCNPEFLACLRRNNEALTLQIIARINGDALSPEDSIRLIETPNVLEKRHLGIKAAQRSGSPIHHHSIEPQKSKQAYKQDHEIPGGSMLRL